MKYIKVSHSYRIWDVFAQPEVASEVRRTSHFVTSDVVSYPLRYSTIHIPCLSEQVIWSMSDLSLLQLLVPLKTKVDIAVLTGDRATQKQSQNRPKTLGLDARYFWDSLAC